MAMGVERRMGLLLMCIDADEGMDSTAFLDGRFGVIGSGFTRWSMSHGLQYNRGSLGALSNGGLGNDLHATLEMEFNPHTALIDLTAVSIPLQDAVSLIAIARLN